MKIVTVKILREFWTLHPNAEQHLNAWADEVKKATWTQPADIKAKRVGWVEQSETHRIDGHMMGFG